MLAGLFSFREDRKKQKKKSRKKKRKAISYDDSKKVARHKDRKVRADLASREDVRPEVLYFLAEDDDPEVRREIAANEKTPRQADLILAKDNVDEVRCDLALKIGRLVPDISERDSVVLRELTFQVLEILAKDQLPLVRQLLAEEIKHSAQVPKPIVDGLARDIELMVAAPILEYSPLLDDQDLLEIIRSDPVQGALSAISRRPEVSTKISDAIVAAKDLPAAATLLNNDNAQIREETLDHIIDIASEAEDEPASEAHILHEPLVKRPELSQRAIRRVAGFVASSLLDLLQTRHKLDDDTKQTVQAAVKRRLKEKPEEDDDVVKRAEEMHNRGKITDKGLAKCIEDGDRELIIHALALKAEIEPPITRKIMLSRDGKTITALAWKAGLNMRTALDLQRKVAHVPPSKVVNARDGVDYSLSEDEMSWFLEFSPARWISVPEIQLAFFVAHGGGPAVRSLRGGAAGAAGRGRSRCTKTKQQKTHLVLALSRPRHGGGSQGRGCARPVRVYKTPPP